MAEQTIKLCINIVIDQNRVIIPCTSYTTAEDVIIILCKQLNICPVTRYLFALRISGKKLFLAPGERFKGKNVNFDLRIRYKPASVLVLKKIDIKAYDYYFHQVRNDVLENKVIDSLYEKYKQELLGLGITDMFRVMIEKDIPQNIVENDYKKYIPREVMKKHPFFVKKPIHEHLSKLRKNKHDAWYIRAQYLAQVDKIAPEYLGEDYNALTEQDGRVQEVIVRVSPDNTVEPCVKLCYDGKKENWSELCTIDELCFISIRKDGTVEVSRKNGIPSYLKFADTDNMLSFVSLVDGYYRLMCKWTFNLCKDVATPSLKRLYAMKCHGPVGGEFSYAKLENKRNNKPGCFILRESEDKYNTYFIDICSKDSQKPKTYKLERLPSDEFIFNDDPTKYKCLVQLMQAYDKPDGSIFLKEQLPPSEYDESPLLLCKQCTVSGDSLTDSATVPDLLPKMPVCISTKDLQIYKGNLRKQQKFPANVFPDLPDYPSKQCRNPDADPGGPWCFVETENGDTGEVEKEYCDVPFCDDQTCMVFTKKSPSDEPVYNHFVNFDPKLRNVTFGIKLWDSDSVFDASARILLSVLPLPVTGKQVEKLGVGIEIYISNTKSALTFGNSEEPEYQETFGIIKSTEYTMFSLTWHAGVVSLNVLNELKPIFLAEYKTKNNLLQLHKNSFRYYSVEGSNLLWTLPLCEETDFCDVFVTFRDTFTHFYPLRKIATGRDLQFYVRAFHSCVVQLQPTPSLDYPKLKIILLSDDNSSRIITQEYENGPEHLIKEFKIPNLLAYWKWHEFSVSLFGNALQLFWTRSIGTHMIAEAKSPVVRSLLWFSVGSVGTTAHWTFYCAPPEHLQPPAAQLPECALNKAEMDYAGTQSVSGEGYPCLPWSGGPDFIPESVRSWFGSGENVLKAKSYCRHPTQTSGGTFCYALDPTGQAAKKDCNLRLCKSSDCKMGGTGNDYGGTLNYTRLNRTCVRWVSVGIHFAQVEDKDYVHGSLFSDLSPEAAENYCRNPSRSVLGPWCYTNDANVKAGFCNVPDCDNREESVIVVKGKHESAGFVYVLPNWKERGQHGGLRFSVKLWDPDLTDGFVFEIAPLSFQIKLKLVLGYENNEKIVLFHDGELVKTYVLPHVLSTGKWVHFWLQMRRDALLLGYEGIPEAIFSWKHPDAAQFEPIFLRYGSLTENPVGVSFMQDNCQTENITNLEFGKIYPVGIWSDLELDWYTNVTFNFRGVADVHILFYFSPNVTDYYLLKITNRGRRIHLHKNEASTEQQLHETETHNQTYGADKWMKYLIAFRLNSFKITVDGGAELFSYRSSTVPLLFRWFSVGAEKGWLLWSANCPVPDIDGPPVDGGWSDWSRFECTVTCGGGRGVRTRTCSNPRPNIFGRVCNGSATSSGTCNDFPCGDVSPSTIDKIFHNLQNQQNSLVVNESSAVLIENDRELLDVISTESPDAYYKWTVNGLKKESQSGLKIVYRSMWKVAKGKKVEVAMKVLKSDKSDEFLKDFMELRGQWAFLQSSAVVKMHGVTLRSPLAMVTEYLKLGNLDEYLREHKSEMQPVDLVEAASCLASAVWHLEENGISHGKIRCRKLLVSCHDENTFKIKLADPGIFRSYNSQEVHWIPVECYGNLEYSRYSMAADVWAFATTLWEIFMFGEQIQTALVKLSNHNDAMGYYKSGKRLPRPPDCPEDIYHLMKECWDPNPHGRKRPQAIVRDVNQMLYQVYNSRRTHSYAKVFPKSKFTVGQSTSSLNTIGSGKTDETYLGSVKSQYHEEPISASSLLDSEADLISLSSGISQRNLDRPWLDDEAYTHSDSCDFSARFPFQFSTASTSLNSINSIQSIFDLDEDCNVVLQGRIGQGFYGEVYKGILERIGDSETIQVAVKKLKTDAMSSESQDFEREIAIMKTLKHPNIVEILGVKQDPEISLVMEYVPHGSLQSYLKIYRESLTTKELLKFSLDIATGMDYLGNKHIVHRDLAARNILVVDKNHVKISDFGLAQVMGQNEYYILKTNREMPIKWYAPESLRDGKFSTKSDVWSYGVTLCEMFAFGEELKLPDMESTESSGQEQQDLLSALENGMRFPCPPKCPHVIYVRMIIPCWDKDAHRRPNFKTLCSEAEDLLQQY